MYAFLLVGCNSRSLEDFQEEGESQTLALVKELQMIHHRDELIEAIPRLQKRFDKLVQVAINAREFYEKHAFLELLEVSKKGHELSDQLRFELQRLYRLEGGKEIIEKCQEPALHRLDAFEKRLKKVR
jgi:hypothetical protein